MNPAVTITRKQKVDHLEIVFASLMIGFDPKTRRLYETCSHELLEDMLVYWQARLDGLDAEHELQRRKNSRYSTTNTPRGGCWKSLRTDKQAWRNGGN